MQSNLRGPVGVAVSLLIAAVVALVLARLHDQTSRRPEPFAMPSSLER